MGMRSFGWKETVVSFGIYYMKWIFGLWGTEIVGIFYITGEDSGWTDWPSGSFWNTTWRCTSHVQTRGTETEQTQCEGWSLLHNKGHHSHKIEVRSDALKCNASLIMFTMLQESKAMLRMIWECVNFWIIAWLLGSEAERELVENLAMLQKTKGRSGSVKLKSSNSNSRPQRKKLLVTKASH